MLDALRCRQDDPSWLGWRLPIVAETGELLSPALYCQDVLQFAEKFLTLTGLKRSPGPRMLPMQVQGAAKLSIEDRTDGAKT